MSKTPSQLTYGYFLLFIMTSEKFMHIFLIINPMHRQLTFSDFNYINSCVRHQQMLFPLCPVQCISGRISLKNTHNPSNLRKLPATCVNPHPLWTPAAGEPCCLPYVNGAERRTCFVSSFIISLSSEVLHGQITSSGRGRGREGGGGQAEERICSGA